MSVHLAWLEEVTELFQRRWWPFILLCLDDGPKGVRQILQTINDQVSDPISEGVLYRNLNDLHDDHLVEAIPAQGLRAGSWTLTPDAEPMVYKLRQLKRAVEWVANSDRGAGGTMAAESTPGAQQPNTDPAQHDLQSPPRPSWAPPGVDITRPSIARVYDCFLGGNHNFAVDREQAELSNRLVPLTALRAKANRAFLGRAVRYLLQVGVRQFLDIGSGIPTVGNVHEIVDRTGITAPVVYVDIDAVAVAHTEQILAGHPRAGVVHEDARHPQAILDHPHVHKLLDLHQPIGLLMVALLHAIPDEDDPYEIVRRFTDRLAPGSYIAIAHVTGDGLPAQYAAVSSQLSKRTTTPITLRSRAQVAAFFDGLELVAPGLVWGPRWRPEPATDPEISPEQSWNYVGVARKPGPTLRPLRRDSTGA